MIYKVEVTRHLCETKIIEVEADDEFEAKDVAKQEVDNEDGEWDQHGIVYEDSEVIED